MSDEVNILQQKLFKNKKISDILQQIYENNKQNKENIQSILDSYQTITQQLKQGDPIQILSTVLPSMKNVLQTKVKNDQVLIKMTTVVQKLLQPNNNTNNPDNGLLSSSQIQDLKRLTKQNQKETKILLKEQMKIEKELLQQ